MSKKLTEIEINSEYNSIKDSLMQFKDELIKSISKVLEESDIQLGFPILGRVKTLESIIKKQVEELFIMRKTIKEMQDLVGFRIVLLFNRDIEKVIEIIKTNLDVLRTYNTQDRLQDDQFGYSSIHCIARLKKAWLEVPMFKDFGDFICEIQVRTLSQHTWAASTYLIEYKETALIPKPLKRSISRLSALLETVDLEFERLLLEKQHFQKLQEESLHDNYLKEILNQENLIKILDKHLPEQNKSGTENYIKAIEGLTRIGITTVSQLVEIIEKYKDAALDFETSICAEIIKSNSDVEYVTINDIKYLKNKLEKTDFGNTYYNHIGLLTLILKLQKEDQVN
ncbi:MAG: RelA/SpoT domain-containing protein [Prolixibacteraceae bacterium]|jgi:ppGpp synthetase/RelA/SpoT-type nucleotidyltranferase|nr:RelA/SpoT domain-containing protein [Prolixibacteraceae bacterium]